MASGDSAKKASSSWRRTLRAKAAAPSVYLEVLTCSVRVSAVWCHFFHALAHVGSLFLELCESEMRRIVTGRSYIIIMFAGDVLLFDPSGL